MSLKMIMTYKKTLRKLSAFFLHSITKNVDNFQLLCKNRFIDKYIIKVEMKAGKTNGIWRFLESSYSKGL